MFKLQLRGFISILLSLAFFIVVITGLVLWLSHSPQTFGIGKGVWKHTHIFMSLIMLISGVLHLWLNWSCYWHYLWNSATRRLNQKRELIAALAIVALVLGTAAIDNHGGMGPFGAMSLQDIAKRAGKPVEDIVAMLEKEGIEVRNSADSLMEIAKQNESPPERILSVLHEELPPTMPPR